MRRPECEVPPEEKQLLLLPPGTRGLNVDLIVTFGTEGSNVGSQKSPAEHYHPKLSLLPCEPAETWAPLRYLRNYLAGAAP